MSYCIVDSTGAANDFATSQGIVDLEAVAGPKLTSFLDTGEADEALAKEIVTEVKDDDATAYIADLFGGTAPFVLSNGIEEDDQADGKGEKYSEDQPRDESGRWTAGSGTTQIHNWVDANVDNITVYHGTSSKAWEAIQKDGLKPTDKKLWPQYYYVGDRAASVFMTADKDAADLYAAYATGKVGKGAQPLTLKITIPKDSIGKLRGDTVDVRAVRYEGTIPSSWISRESKADDQIIYGVLLFTDESDDGLKYSDDQPRDDHGRWTDAGGSGSTGGASDASSAANDLYTAATGGETGITGHVKDAVTNNGGEVHGLEHRIKTADSLTRKIESDAKVKNLSAKDAAAQINDSLRYTGVFPNDKFSAGAEQTLNDLRSAGYTVTQVKNFWGSDTYRGTNVHVTSPDGQKFELQFHTPESFQLKIGKSWAIYEKMRTSTSPSARAKYGAQLTQLWSAITSPLNWASVKRNL